MKEYILSIRWKVGKTERNEREYNCPVCGKWVAKHTGVNQTYFNREILGAKGKSKTLHWRCVEEYEERFRDPV